MPADIARIAFAQREYRSATSTDAAVKTRHPLATELTYNTFLASESEASSFGTEILDLRKVERMTWSCYVNRQNYSIEVGDTITLSYPRFGLINGKNFIVKRVKRDSNILYDELTLYGPE